MAMQGIDIASYQAGIDLNAVPCDFAIVKATEGTGYTNPDCDRAVQQCIGLGKPWGVYHYVNGSGADGEADFFIDQCAGYVRHGILCVDWESGGNAAWGDLDYLGAVVDRIIERTGVKPLIYASASVYDDVASVAGPRDCGLWIAQYANMDATGYQDNPWNEGAYQCVMRQYASTGRLPNWGGNLDLDIFYGNSDTWNAYATGGKGALSMDASKIIEGWSNGLNGNQGLYTNVIDTNIRIQQVQATLEAQTAAIKALAEMRGGDPEKVAQAVSDAVQKKLEGLRFSVKED